MKNAIIQHSIVGLQREGLRFSIDEVAKSLKISKKTIYNFATKEELAVEIYNVFYEGAMQSIADIDRDSDRAALMTIVDGTLQ